MPPSFFCGSKSNFKGTRVLHRVGRGGGGAAVAGPVGVEKFATEEKGVSQRFLT
jgi:hypothetical protein